MQTGSVAKQKPTVNTAQSHFSDARIHVENFVDKIQR